MSKNTKITRENLMDSTPEVSDVEDTPKPAVKAAAAKKESAPVKSQETKKEAPKASQSKKESSHHKDEQKHAAKSEESKVKAAPKKEESAAPKKDKEAKAPKKDKEVKAPKKDSHDEEAKLGRRDQPSKPAPKKDQKIKEISDLSDSESEDEKPKKQPLKKKEEKAAVPQKKSETSATNSKKVSFHEPESSAAEAKNKKVKTAVAVHEEKAKAVQKKTEKEAPAAAKKDESKLGKLKQALKKQESSSDEAEEEESEDGMEIESSEESEEEEKKPVQARKASAEKAAPARKASAEKAAPARKASAEKAAPAQRKASAEKPVVQEQPKFNTNRQDNGNSRFGPEFEVIVFGLPFSSSESDIRTHFSGCSDLKFVKVMMGQDGRPRGKAFIKFSSEKGMNAALALNGSNLGGRSISVELTDKMKGGQGAQNGNQNFGNRDFGNQGGQQQNGDAPENTNVMIKNLAFTVDEAKLQAVFSGCGPIKAVRICKNETGQSRGFGFVDFTSIESARNAIKKSNEKIDGRPVTVLYSKPRDPSAPRGGGNFVPRNNTFGAEKKGNLGQFTGETVDLE